MATQALAKWTVDLKPSSLPASVKHAAARSLYNYIGCVIGGSGHPAMTKAYDALMPFFGPATSTLYGHGGRRQADAQHAALLNGIASHVHDYDDTHLATIIHPTGPVASALLAYAEYAGGVSGMDLVCALTAGIETSCKVGLAVWPQHYDIGWHITSTTGSIGAALAVGKLMGLSEAQMSHAIGLAAVQVVGLREMFGSDTKSFHPGRAAQSGLLAALMAQKGYTSSPQALEAKRGWANVMRERRRRVEDVASVKARVHPLVIELTSKRTPKDGLEGKFSVFHGAAVGLLYGKAGPALYADKVVQELAVVNVREKVEATPDKDLAPDETHLTLEFADGEQIVQHVLHAVGSLEVPMTDEQLTEKFIDQAGLVLGSDAQEASDAAWRLSDADDVVSILQTL
ncbi:hypothetical protein BAUCODRAFT_67911 [Baudoinia panamericana UAMH 10762]|uniref:MmgE/PrpD N-terminal domain-containing protein n=1 Tax=Baudoinia panamericana (strain UAMH 10762) TaxID=717646 RepID=M2MLP6_BAUPA|nr:uncharacterized protein BAUCODRAFT_67911 [Baudoinia panamericana UAMH 10762]EMC97576.1 hypothetical protein BAUCODRAFT_67911 [Baudoinia panamericana UAMH 10762]